MEEVRRERRRCKVCDRPIHPRLAELNDYLDVCTRHACTVCWSTDQIVEEELTGHWFCTQCHHYVHDDRYGQRIHTGPNDDYPWVH